MLEPCWKECSPWSQHVGEYSKEIWITQIVINKQEILQGTGVFCEGNIKSSMSHEPQFGPCCRERQFEGLCSKALRGFSGKNLNFLQWAWNQIGGIKIRPCLQGRGNRHGTGLPRELHAGVSPLRVANEALGEPMHYDAGLGFGNFGAKQLEPLNG